MEIEELKSARHQLENDLKKEIDMRVSEFVEKTGIQIDRVMVDMIFLDIVGVQPSTVVNGVRVGLVL